MTVPPLPSAFVSRMRSLLGRDASAYFAAMEAPPVRGLRIHPMKTPNAPLTSLVEGVGEAVPWAANGRYLSLESGAGLHPLHEAGAYYLQEPSAMLPATLLAARPGETVLDLCAAPGGKATQLADSMAGQGTLAVNEIVPARAQVLSRNMERMGVPNALVTCATPDQLAQKWPLLFDAVLVDAPCSGEGMFRRHPETRLEWDEGAPKRCAQRQKAILESACRMLKPGGRLCYSTCTLNRTENEDVVSAFLNRHPEFQPVVFSVPIYGARMLASQNGCVRLYPHEVAGEGHFAALLMKTDLGEKDTCSPCALQPAPLALSAPGRTVSDTFTAFWQASAREEVPLPNAMLGERLFSAPDLPPLNGIRVLRAGLALGRLKGKAFAPEHALALAAPPFALRSLPLTATQTAEYLDGQALPAPGDERGWYTVNYAGLALGFVKASDRQLKNHYPKGLRRPILVRKATEGETDGND